jgi:subtilase family serine protease
VNSVLKLVASLAAVLAVTACNAGGSSSLPGAVGQQARGLAKPACPLALRGGVQCLVLVESRPGSGTSGYGWTPANIQAAYNLPSSTKGSGQLVAIVDSYDNPDVASDLTTYRSKFGLGSVKFRKYNEKGQQRNYPSGSPEWGVEIDLDVQMVSAVCPKCSIDLVEASSEASPDMQKAEATAVKLGAHVVSNSWICYSYSCVLDPQYFDKPGVVYTAGSGDASYGLIGPPSTFPSVVAVGGTVLSQSGSGYSETVWGGAGSGCASEMKKPKWQHDPGCSSRTDSDVAAVAQDVAEFDSFSAAGWITVSGTSVATPLIAGVYALAGNASSQNAAERLWTLKKKKRNKDLHYISIGNNGTCGGSYLCTAGTEQFKTYSGPSGWGTPNGIGAF